MPVHIWASSNNNNASTGYWPQGCHVYTDGIGMPTARLDISGNRPIWIGSIHSYVASGGGINPVLIYQGVEFGGGNRRFGSSGGTAQFSLRSTGGDMTFGRQTGTGLSVRDARDGYTWGGSTLAGGCDWAQVANAPTSFTSTVNGMSVTFASPGSSDNGGGTITAYWRQVSINGGAWGGETPNWGSTYTMTPGNTYQFRLYAVNLVGDGPATYTPVINANGGGKRYNGSAFVPLTTAKRFNGSAWVDLSTRKRYNGSAWVDINN